MEQTIEAENLRDSATLTRLRAGAIRKCPQHEDVFVSALDRDASRSAYRLGAAMVADDAVEATEEDMARAIAHIISAAALECPLCEVDVAA